MQSDPVTVTEAETIDFDWVQPESQLMRRAKAHFDRLGIAYYEKSSDFYFEKVHFAFSTGRVWIQGQPAFRCRGFRFLHNILQVEGRGRPQKLKLNGKTYCQGKLRKWPQTYMRHDPQNRTSQTKACQARNESRDGRAA
jgi:hypothetical protein